VFSGFCASLTEPEEELSVHADRMSINRLIMMTDLVVAHILFLISTLLKIIIACITMVAVCISTTAIRTVIIVTAYTATTHQAKKHPLEEDAEYKGDNCHNYIAV
jgi:hypothetical protein